MLKKNLDWIVGILVFAFLCWQYKQTNWLPTAVSYINGTKVDALIASSISLLGAFLGFIISTLAILAGLLDVKIFRKLHASKLTETLINKFIRLIYVTSLALGVNVLALLVDSKTGPFFGFGIVAVSLVWLWNFIWCMGVFESVLKKKFNSSSLSATVP